MHFSRLVEEKNEVFLRAFALYETSFPSFEQRSKPEQLSILQCSEYHFDVIYDNDEFVGIMLYWETESFIYVEHFCINSTVRGKGYGQSALNILKTKDKTVILEIDPPDDEIAQRRKRFYIKAGYVPNSFNHIHPPYNPSLKGHKLVVLSHPCALSEELYSSFNNYLTSTVMSQTK